MEIVFNSIWNNNERCYTCLAIITFTLLHSRCDYNTITRLARSLLILIRKFHLSLEINQLLFNDSEVNNRNRFECRNGFYDAKLSNTIIKTTETTSDIA
jgi:hypothetical protein